MEVAALIVFDHVGKSFDGGRVKAVDPREEVVDSVERPPVALSQPIGQAADDLELCVRQALKFDHWEIFDGLFL